MATPRSLWTDINNALDLLFDRNVLFAVQNVSLRPPRVAWHALQPITFLDDDDGSIGQYLRWLNAGHYSALLTDGSLLQLDYTVEGGRVAKHRLCYVPCPVLLDAGLVEQGDSIADFVELVSMDDVLGSVLLRSSVRFDYDPAHAAEGHPGAHLTLNDAHCRIGCVAPLHPHRFIDFIFSNFYPRIYEAHSDWFEEASTRTIRSRALTDPERQAMHISWPL